MHTLLVFLPTMPLSPVYIPESLPKQTAYTKALATATALGGGGTRTPSFYYGIRFIIWEFLNYEFVFPFPLSSEVQGHSFTRLGNLKTAFFHSTSFQHFLGRYNPMP